MEKINANMILEMLGRPKENIENTMKSLVAQIGSDKGLKINDKTFHEALPVENTKDLFTTFSELSLEFDSPEDLLQCIFKYMPSNVEIVTPQKINMTNQDLTFLTNRLAQKLHQYDAIVKNTLEQRDILGRKLKEVAPHLFKKKEDENVKITKEKKEKKSKPTKSKKKNKN